MAEPYELTVVPEPDAEWIAWAHEAIRPIIMPWIRNKLDEWIAEGRLMVEEYEGGRRWRYSGAGCENAPGEPGRGENSQNTPR